MPTLMQEKTKTEIQDPAIAELPNIKNSESE